MSDPLRTQFETFRADSLAATTPPGLRAIRTKVARRHATRAVALAACAVAILLVVWLPGRGNHTVGPVQPPLPSAAPSMTLVSPTPRRSPSKSVKAPTTPKATHTRSSTSSNCGSLGDDPQASVLSTGDPDTFTLSSALLRACPGVRIRITRATYAGLGAKSSTLTLYGSAAQTLTSSSRTTTMSPGSTPSGTCYTYLTVTLIGSGSVPHTIANVVPDIASSGSDDDANGGFRAFDVIGDHWGEPVCP